MRIPLNSIPNHWHKVKAVEDILQDAEQSLDQFLPRKAESALNQAHKILETKNPSDNTNFVRVYSGLATCQIQKTWKKGLAYGDYVRYLQRAQHYADKVTKLAQPRVGFGEKGLNCTALEDVKQRCVELGIAFPVPSYRGWVMWTEVEIRYSLYYANVCHYIP